MVGHVTLVVLNVTSLDGASVSSNRRSAYITSSSQITAVGYQNLDNVRKGPIIESMLNIIHLKRAILVKKLPAPTMLSIKTSSALTTASTPTDASPQ